MPHVFMIQTYMPEDILYNILKNYLHNFLARVFHCSIVSVLKKFQIFECFVFLEVESLGDIVTHEEVWHRRCRSASVSIQLFLCFSCDLSISSLPSKRLYYNAYYHYCILCCILEILAWILDTTFKSSHSI